MTDLTYNGITLKNCVTRIFEQTPVRDSSGTDTLYHQFSISVECVMSASALQGFHGAQGANGNSLAAIIKDTRRKLMEERKYLTYEIGGNAVVDSNSTKDADNGPKPLRCTIHRINNTTVHIVFHVVACLTDCCEGCQPDVVINNRWSSADDIDEQWRTVRHIRGRLRLSTAATNAHAFRSLVVPSLMKGWKRTRMHFIVDPNGLDFSYHITDVEMLGDAPPAPAARWNGSHSVSFGQQGAVCFHDVSVRLDGVKKADKGLLLQRCAQIMQAKLNLLQWNAVTNGIIEHIIFIDHFGDGVCAVEGQGRVQLKGADRGTAMLTFGAAQFKEFGKSLIADGYDKDIAINLGPTPSSTVNLFTSFLNQTRCEGPRQYPQTKSDAIGSSGQQPTEEDEYPQPTYSTGTPDDVYGPEYDSEHEHLYSHYAVETHYPVTFHTCQLPIAAQSVTEQKKASASIVRMAPRTATKHVKIQAERVGEWPKILTPKPFTDSIGIKHVPISFRPNYRPPEHQGDDKLLHVIDAEYDFALDRCPADNEKWATAGIPWDTRTTSENTFPAETNMIAPDNQHTGIGG